MVSDDRDEIVGMIADALRARAHEAAREAVGHLAAKEKVTVRGGELMRLATAAAVDAALAELAPLVEENERLRGLVERIRAWAYSETAWTTQSRLDAITRTIADFDARKAPDV